MKFSNAIFPPRFEYGEQAQVSTLCGADDGTSLDAGLVPFTGIPWTTKYDEFIPVLEEILTA